MWGSVLSWQMSQPDLVTLESLRQVMSRSGMMFCGMTLNSP